MSDVTALTMNTTVFDDGNAQDNFFICSSSLEGGFSAAVTAVYRDARQIILERVQGRKFFLLDTVFLPADTDDVATVLTSRSSELSSFDSEAFALSPRMLRQAPIAAFENSLCVAFHVCVEGSQSQSATFLARDQGCSCDECARAGAMFSSDAQQSTLQTNLIYGAGADAYEQTASMFLAAEALLQSAGFEFADVMRTWLYLPEMERDYAGLNAARREFFESRGVKPVPASTGIGSGLVTPEHCIAMSLYAVRGEHVSRVVMKTPTLNEAPVYGADFSRGMRVEEKAVAKLFVSGTASLDETGQSVHHGDFDAQVKRMLVNVAALLDGQGAGFENIHSAVTYVKDSAMASSLQGIMRKAGFTGFPNAIVHAEVCRPELLVETEVLAMLKRRL